MAGIGQPAIDRLRDFFQGLKPGTRALLIAELERSHIRGDDFAGAELILTELRRSFRAGTVAEDRIADAARLFFQPLEPFLVDDCPEHQHRGRIARSAVEPIWQWISKTLMPEEAKTFTEHVDQALLANDPADADKLARAFQDLAVERIKAALATNDDKVRRRVLAHIGTPRALEDINAVLGVLSVRDDLAALGEKLPGHIKVLAGPQLESVKAILDAQTRTKPEFILYALILLMSRLAAPWQLVRVAKRASGSESTTRIAETPYSVAVTIAMAEIEREVGELASDLKSRRSIAVSAMLKDVHDALRGLRSEVDMAVDTPWGRRLAGVRSTISRVLTAEIELMPGRVRRLIRPMPVKEIVPGSVLDPEEVAEAEALIGFVTACRSYAGELAINEVTQRTFTDLQLQLDTGTRTLIESMRAAGDSDRPYRQSQVDAAVRFCAKVFGKDYASLLSKAAEVAASRSESKPAIA
jgi:hypothetical protein